MPIPEKLKSYIARLEANDPTLTSIDLRWNEIGAAGAKALAHAVRNEYHADVDGSSLWK